MAFPVLAAPAYTDRGFIIEPFALDLSLFSIEEQSNGTIYLADVSLAQEFEVVEGVSSVSVWFGDYKYNSGVIYSDTSSRGDDLCYVGNISLLVSNNVESSLPFALKLDVLSPSSIMVGITPEFYEVLQTDYSGFVTFAIQPADNAPKLISSIFSVFSLVGGFVIGLLNSVTDLFWIVNGSGEITLTLLGALSLAALGISVVFLLIRVIRNFLHFRS